MAADEVKEVVGFLRHSNPAVQQEACKVLTQLCSAPSAVTALAKLNVVPVLLPLISAPPPLPSLSLTLLVLLSSHDDFTSHLLSQPTVSACMETVRSLPHPSSSPSLSLLLQLLVNLTRVEAGAKQLMQDGTAVESLHMRRLLSLFLLPPPLSDPYQHIASLLLNVSVLPSGRRWLLSPSSSALQSLPPFILSSSPAVRQRDVLSLFRNLCLEQSSQQLLLAANCALLENCLLLIAGHGEVREEERDGFFPSVLASMSAAHARHPDAAIRRLVLEIIVLLARYAPSRAVLKQRRVYTVLRELHMKHEQDEAAGGDRQLDELLYDIVPYFILPEDDEAKGGSRATVEELKDDGEVLGTEQKDAAADERTAQLLDELTLSSQAVQAEVETRRAAQQAVAREKAEHDQHVHGQMELRERVDDRVERDDDDDEDEDELPELIEEQPAAAAAEQDADVMERMD